MLKYIEEFGKYVAVVGFRNVNIIDVEKFFSITRRKKLSNVEVQFFDAEFVATWQHLYFAVLNALKAFKNKENITKSLAMETMLFASAQRQIRKSMKLLGIKPDSSEIAVLLIGEKLELIKSAISTVSTQIKAQQDDMVLELSKRKVAMIKKIFEISDLELKTAMGKDDSEEALTDLVIERMALLPTQR